MEEKRGFVFSIPMATVGEDEKKVKKNKKRRRSRKSLSHLFVLVDSSEPSRLVFNTLQARFRCASASERVMCSSDRRF